MMNGNFFQILVDALGLEEVAGDTVPAVILVLLLIVVAAALLVAMWVLVSYVMQAFAIMRMAQKLNVERPWLAWIPVAQSYELGRLAEQCDSRQDLPVKPWAKILLFSHIGFMVFNSISSGFSALLQLIVPFVGPAILSLLLSALSLAFSVLVYICVWKIFREFYPKKVHVVAFVVSVLFNVHPLGMLIASFFQPRRAYEHLYEAVASVSAHEPDGLGE